MNKILRAGNDHEKEYLVTVDKPITDEFIRGMGGGGADPRDGDEKSAKSKKKRRLSSALPLVQGAEPSDPAHVRALWLRSEKSWNVRAL